MTSLAKAGLIALLVPALLLGGAYVFQYFPQVFGLAQGLFPCEMCWWQRYPHFAAVALAALAFVLPQRLRTPAVILAGLAILASGLIGAFHAGVEYHWWEGLTQCTANSSLSGSSGDMLGELLKTPLVRCDAAQWTLWGASLAGWNAIVSIPAGLVVLWLGRTPRP